MLILAVSTWWLLAGKCVALPVGARSSSVAPVTIDSHLGSSSTDEQTFSSPSNDNSVPAFVSSAAAVRSEYTNSPGKTREDTRAAANRPTSASVDLSAVTGSKTTTMPQYALTLAELLSAITAEFVFNVAGDHVLFPMDQDAEADRRLHETAVIVAELLQKLHIAPDVYRILNTTACEVAGDMRSASNRGRNPVARVLQLTAEAAVQDPVLRDEYLAAKKRTTNQIYGLPAQHGKFASVASQTLYDVTGQQLAYAEQLMKEARVKRLVMSVTFFKASQFEETSVPEWVRSQTRLAAAIYRLAKQPQWRDEVQRLFDEAVAECVDGYDAMDGDDEMVFRILRQKVEKNAAVSVELEKMGKFAQTNT